MRGGVTLLEASLSLPTAAPTMLALAEVLNGWTAICRAYKHGITFCGFNTDTEDMGKCGGVRDRCSFIKMYNIAVYSPEQLLRHKSTNNFFIS
jgi:hypothetical protein